MEKDKVEIENHKNKMIEEIKKINKMEMFKETQIKKISILDKLLLILGYGKKRWGIKSVGNHVRFIRKGKYWK